VYLVTEGATWDQALAKRQALSAKIDSLQATHQVKMGTAVTPFVSSQGYFSSAADAYDYIFSSRFRNRSNTVELEFTQQGLCANGNYISGAPQIINASSSEALVKVKDGHIT